MTWAVRFDGVSKRYRGGGPRYASLRHDLASLFRPAAAARSSRRPDEGGIVALEDVSFEVQDGESFAIIGPNGAGKTTALKLMARISYPSAGRIRVRGRVGALIEVGSGVHPELSARENIWLFGRILGMRRDEVRRQFDEIVAFAELENVLDMPVKMYSSGMQLRLGFSIASHLNPEVFVVDEALAVGDAAFQARCIERMTALVDEGRTLLFVSHALPLVRQVCDRALLLDRGAGIAIGPVDEVIDTYLRRVSLSIGDRGRADDVIRIERVRIDDGDSAGHRLHTDGRVRIEIGFDVGVPVRDAVFGVGLTDGRPGNLISMSMLSERTSVTLETGRHVLTCELERVPLLPGAYEVWFSSVSEKGTRYYAHPRVVGTLVVADGPAHRKRDHLFGRTGGFGPVSVEYDLRIRSAKGNLVDENGPTPLASHDPGQRGGHDPVS